MILNGLDKLGVVVHEPEVPGLTKIDARLTHETGTALIEITSVSDRGRDEANPVGQLSEELIRRVIAFGLNPSRKTGASRGPGGFYQVDHPLDMLG